MLNSAFGVDTMTILGLSVPKTTLQNFSSTGGSKCSTLLLNVTQKANMIRM